MVRAAFLCGNVKFGTPGILENLDHEVKYGYRGRKRLNHEESTIVNQ
jgi:hypothetical protein